MSASQSVSSQQQIRLVPHTGNVWGAVVENKPAGFTTNMSFGVFDETGRALRFECYFVREMPSTSGGGIELRFFDRSRKRNPPSAKLTLVANSPAI